MDCRHILILTKFFSQEMNNSILEINPYETNLKIQRRELEKAQVIYKYLFCRRKIVYAQFHNNKY